MAASISAESTRIPDAASLDAGDVPADHRDMQALTKARRLSRAIFVGVPVSTSGALLSQGVLPFAHRLARGRCVGDGAVGYHSRHRRRWLGACPCARLATGAAAAIKPRAIRTANDSMGLSAERLGIDQRDHRQAVRRPSSSAARSQTACGRRDMPRAADLRRRTFRVLGRKQQSSFQPCRAGMSERRRRDMAIVSPPRGPISTASALRPATARSDAAGNAKELPMVEVIERETVGETIEATDQLHRRQRREDFHGDGRSGRH